MMMDEKRRNFLKGVGAGAAAAALNPVAAPAVWAAGKTYTWKMATAWPKTLSILQTGAEHLAKQIEVMTEGRLVIEVSAGGTLVGALEVFDAVSAGNVECGHAAAYYWARKIPAAQWFTTVPFGLRAHDLNTWVITGGGYELWREIYAPHGVIPFLAGNTGIQMGGWFNREIKTIEDFKGLNMRIPGLGGKVIEKLGANVFLLPAGEIYAALESGKINATEWIGPYHDLQMGFDKIAKYYYAPGWHEPGTAFEFIVNRKAYESLPRDIQEIVRAAAAELNAKILAEFEYYNAMAMLGIAQKRQVQLRQFPFEVLRFLEGLAAEVLEVEAGKDPQAKKVHEAFKKFKKDMSTYSLLRGDELRV